MSGTDYTLTANLGLYKPIYDMDVEQWAGHLNANADILDAQFGGAGAWLPLAGGTMTGPVALAGVSTAPLAAPGNNSTQIASTAFIAAALALYAPLNAPVFTGDARGVTAPPNDNDSSLATTAFVAAALAAVAPQPNNTGRNLIHNGLFGIWQRGNGPFTVANAYTADRWQLVLTVDTASVTAQVLVDADRTAIGDEHAFSALRNVFTGNAAANAQTFMAHKVEAVRRLSGKTVTLSFWARSGAPLNLGLNLAQVFGTGGSPSPPVWLTPAPVAVTPTWARHSVTFAVSSAAGKVFGTNQDDCTWVTFWHSSGATGAAISGIGVQSGTVDIWGVQLEISSGATPLAKRDPADELALCQRFYQIGHILWGGYITSGSYYASTQFLVQMRATPTLSLFNDVSSGFTPRSVTAIGTTGAYMTAAPTTGNTTALLNSDFTASADL